MVVMWQRAVRSQPAKCLSIDPTKNVLYDLRLNKLLVNAFATRQNCRGNKNRAQAGFFFSAPSTSSLGRCRTHTRSLQKSLEMYLAEKVWSVILILAANTLPWGASLNHAARAAVGIVAALVRSPPAAFTRSDTVALNATRALASVAASPTATSGANTARSQRRACVGTNSAFAAFANLLRRTVFTVLVRTALASSSGVMRHPRFQPANLSGS